MNIYELIPEDRYISRQELVAITGLCDRVVREEINRLRKNPDTVIISSSKHKGYKKPRSKEDLSLCINEIRSRIEDLEQQKSALEFSRRNWGRKKPRQMEFDFGGT